MEAIVNVVQGDTFNTSNKECLFCGKNQLIQFFCITNGNKYNGTVLKFFPLCPEHIDKMNSLLTGEFDIDKIILNKYRKSFGNTLQFRG